MPRRKRNDVTNQTPVPVATTTAEVTTGAAPPRHAVRVRMTCPVCGMMPEIERLFASPYAAEVRVQKFGGSLPATNERPMVGFMQYDFGSPEQLLDALHLFLILSEEARRAVLELLPDAYRDAGLAVPPEVEAGDLGQIMVSLPPRDVLLERLLTEDTVFRLKRAG
ncbi:MAG: hypothetical protein QME70_09635 [Bacillota bacterium]|nr:hypothetical protein [Bacillota bacterium]